MPMHDWKATDAGYYHTFHQAWSIHLMEALNRGLMPRGYFAMTDGRVALADDREGEPDIFAVASKRRSPTNEGGAALMEPPIRTKIVEKASLELESYSRRANRLLIKYKGNILVAVIEIVSPGNKHSIKAFSQFIEKTTRLLDAGVSVLVVDPFPPTKRDPKGVHAAIWEPYTGKSAKMPARKKLTLASYRTMESLEAYVEPFGVGDVLRTMPLFLLEGRHAAVPLEQTYMSAWEAFPEEMREAIFG